VNKALTTFLLLSVYTYYNVDVGELRLLYFKEINIIFEVLLRCFLGS
jgi:hypothetical protein